MLTIENLRLSHAGRPVLRDVTLSAREGECLCIVGPNGCGKSSFLRILAGIERADGGEFRKPTQATIGYLPQEADLDSDHTLEAELLTAFDTVRAALDEMGGLEARMGEVPHDTPEYEEIAHRYSECLHIVDRQDGYNLEPRARKVAAGLGFSQADLSRPCRAFSGGWQMRILLAKLLLRMPDILLLDEPTNHLDLETTLWLENWIKTCGRTVLMVSHERATMDRLADRIVCLQSGVANVYPGDYTRYLVQSEAKREAEWAAYNQQAEEIKVVEAFISRFRANASKASLVQSRIKQLAKVVRLEAPFHPTAIQFEFPPAPPCNREVVTLSNVAKRYGDTEVFANIDLDILRGEKIGLVGANGAGKSTLLKLLSQREEASEGQLEYGDRVRIAYFAQYDADSLKSNDTLLQAIEASAPAGKAHRSRDVLGAFLFQGDAADKPLRALSGGERTRFRLAQILFSPANLLLLDEPTNHLDVTSRATVEEALRKYQGTAIVVSHDRVFMDRVATKIVEVRDGRVRLYPGRYSEYLASIAVAGEEDAGLGGNGSGDRDELRLSVRQATGTNAPRRAPDAAESRIEQPVMAGNGESSNGDEAHAANTDAQPSRLLSHEDRKALGKKIKAIERKVEKLEAQIVKQEAEIAQLDAELADPETSRVYAKFTPIVQQRRKLLEANAKTTVEWEQATEELEREKALL